MRVEASPPASAQAASSAGSTREARAWYEALSSASSAQSSQRSEHDHAACLRTRLNRARPSSRCDSIDQCGAREVAGRGCHTWRASDAIVTVPDGTNSRSHASTPRSIAHLASARWGDPGGRTRRYPHIVHWTAQGADCCVSCRRVDAFRRGVSPGFPQAICAATERPARRRSWPRNMQGMPSGLHPALSPQRHSAGTAPQSAGCRCTPRSVAALRSTRLGAARHLQETQRVTLRSNRKRASLEPRARAARTSLIVSAAWPVAATSGSWPARARVRVRGAAVPRWGRDPSDGRAVRPRCARAAAR